MAAMRAVLAFTLVLGACTFDDSGTRYEGPDPAVDAGGTDAVTDARPIDAALPAPVDAPPPAIDASSWCDFDQQCEAGEDPDWCLDCSGSFVCDFDSTCEQGESDACLDCLGGP